MSDVLQIIRQSEIQFAAGGTRVDLTALSSWWRRPVYENRALNNLCRGSPAEALLIDGILKTTVQYVSDKSLRELMTQYMKHACALTVDPDHPCEFALPYWICWIRDTQAAVRQWDQLMDSFQLPDVKVEFAAVAWSRGMRSISASYPRAALRFWAESAERLQHRVRYDSAAFFDAARFFQEAQALAMEVGIEPPISPSGMADATSITEQIETWCSEKLAQALDKLFWAAHLQFLSLVRARSSPALKRGRKAKLTQLIGSANRGRSPDLIECLAICRAYEEVLSELLGNLPRSDQAGSHRLSVQQPPTPASAEGE